MWSDAASTRFRWTTVRLGRSRMIAVRRTLARWELTVMQHLKLQFVVADGARARWVRRSAIADDFVTSKETKAERQSRGEPQGVVFEGTSGRRFTVEERRGAVREHREAFARASAKLVKTLAKDLSKIPDHALGAWLRPLELA